MDGTIITVVSDLQFANPVERKPDVSADSQVRSLRRFASTGLPCVVVHSGASSEQSSTVYRDVCSEIGATYVKKDFNTYYGGGINIAMEYVKTPAVIYLSARRARIHRPEWIGELLRPIRLSSSVGMSGCIQPANISIVTGNTRGLEDHHVQGAIWAARSDVIRAVPYGREFPQVYSDVAQAVNLQRAGYILASADGIGAVAGGVIPDPLNYHAISDYRSWSGFQWRHSFGENLGNLAGPSAIEDQRVDQFYEAFPSVNSVLELGSFEGNHTLKLARKCRNVTTIEGRHENQGRAEFVKEWFDVSQHVTPTVADVRRVEIPEADAIFCSGLLYHLDNPRHFLAKIGAKSDRLFFWTHISDGGEKNEGLDGKWMPEYGYADMLSGLQQRSFWLTEQALIDELGRLGFQSEIIARNTQNNGKAITLKAWK